MPANNSNLARVLSSGHFAVTAELSPPRSVDLAAIEHDAGILRGHADAINVTDNQAATVYMSSIVVSSLLVQRGLEPVAQMTCRDRNRLAIQSDLLGASALGIRNLLCLSGDHAKWGDHPDTKPVYDLDSMHLLGLVRKMGAGFFENGQPIPDHPPHFFIGAAANPFAPPYEYRPLRLAKKVAAGAQFIQTQLVFNLKRFREYMRQVRDLGLDKKVPILAGVGPIRSMGAARFMAQNVAGMDVPEEYLERMEKAPRGRKAKEGEGINICLEIIQAVREIPGVAGIHIMAIHWPEAVPELVERAGLHPRPVLEEAPQPQEAIALAARSSS